MESVKTIKPMATIEGLELNLVGINRRLCELDNHNNLNSDCLDLFGELEMAREEIILEMMDVRAKGL